MENEHFLSYPRFDEFVKKVKNYKNVMLNLVLNLFQYCFSI
jgi:hypothetical protein